MNIWTESFNEVEHTIPSTECECQSCIEMDSNNA